MFLDFYTTDYAIRNLECVVEMNPLYSERPSTAELVFKKSIVVFYLDRYLTEADYDYVNGTYSIILLNNLNVIRNGC